MNVEIVYREKIEELVALRIEFLQDVRKTRLSESEYIAACHENRSYLNKVFSEKAFVGFIGRTEEGIAACTAGLLFYCLPPLLTGGERKVGHVLTFFTRSEYRRRGWGLQLMKEIQSFAKSNNVVRLILEATAEGLPLYLKAGFQTPDQPVLVQSKPF